MRCLWRVSLLLAMATGCGNDVLNDTTYRRLFDTFDTYDQCLSDGNFAPCYQTLTFCPDGRVNAFLDYREEGRYQVQDSSAIATLPTVTIVFDLEKATSSQLPGRHPWELVELVAYDCAP